MIRTILSDVQVTENGSTEPVSLALTKSYLGIASDVHNPLLEMLITASRREVEHYIKAKLIDSTVTAYYDSINEYTRLPLNGFKEITSVQDETEIDLSYTIGKGSNPKLTITSESGVVVVYECELDCNEDLQLCIIKKVGEDFENRTGIAISQNSLLPNNWRETALKYRTTWLM